jgi:predicted CXXCH cytochrome family protein
MIKIQKITIKVNLYLKSLVLLTLTSLSLSAFAAEYVGTAQCASCHENEFKAWQGSDHDMAMRHAKPDAVLGNFDNASIIFQEQENKFFRKGEQYWVNIEGPDGKFHDYQIKYTFAHQPLQQYMVEFDDGRVQLIPFAWDSRTKAEGGQRWFHLYPEYTDKHEEYFWTNTGQNWNYMCADCHSTNVEKNFDLATNSYKTTFSEINVGCEACHGPASDHMQWTKGDKTDKSSMGFNRNLDKQVEHWLAKPGDSTLSAEKIIPTQQTLVCAQCHSRHVQISENSHVDSNEFGERYMLSLINSSLYYPDGQIYDEDFVYGSFLQSKMNKAGVVCSNCHDPHTSQLLMPEKVVCLQCHLPESYATTEHHKHQEDSAGAQCVNCHMPETTYMQIDKRRDHAWHVPRPDLSQKLGTPDTCLSCHKDKNSDWSSDHTTKWYPDSKIQSENHFAPVFAMADQGYQKAAQSLSHIAQNIANSDIIRASALDRMAPFADTNTLIAIARGVKNPDTNIRLGAIRGAAGIAPAERWRILAPLLSDSVLSIRAEAAVTLAPLWQELSKEQITILQPALTDYFDIQTFNADRGYSHTNKANIYVHQQKFEQAIAAYKKSIEIEPNFVNAYSHLSEVYRMQNKADESINALKQGLIAVPDNGELAYRIGLGYVRSKQPIVANQYFDKAVSFEPNNAQYHYVYGLSLENENLVKAQKMLSRSFSIAGNPQHLFTLCDMQIRHRLFQAKQCIQKLSDYAPENVIQQLNQQLEENK